MKDFLKRAMAGSRTNNSVKCWPLENPHRHPDKALLGAGQRAHVEGKIEQNSLP